VYIVKNLLLLVFPGWKHWEAVHVVLGRDQNYWRLKCLWRGYHFCSCSDSLRLGDVKHWYTEIFYSCSAIPPFQFWISFLDLLTRSRTCSWPSQFDWLFLATLFPSYPINDTPRRKRKPFWRETSKCARAWTKEESVSIAIHAWPMDPLIHYGHHFGHTVHALCNFQALLTNGILHLQELAERSPESFTIEYVPFFTPPTLCTENCSNRERREHKVFQQLLDSVPNLEERLIRSDDELTIVADLVSTTAIISRMIWTVVVTKRSIWCKRRRHQESKSCRLGLDHPKRSTAHSSSRQEHQERSWLSSWADRIVAMPNWLGLV
jgi:hypothetical protein